MLKNRKGKTSKASGDLFADSERDELENMPVRTFLSSKAAHEKRADLASMPPPAPPAAAKGCLSGVKAVVSVWICSGTSDASEAAAERLRKLGASASCGKIDSHTTHLIFKDGCAEKFAAARKHDVCIVPTTWISACEEDEARVDEDEYAHLVKAPKPSDAMAKPQARPKSVDPAPLMEVEEIESSSQRFPETSRARKEPAVVGAHMGSSAVNVADGTENAEGESDGQVARAVDGKEDGGEVSDVLAEEDAQDGTEKAAADRSQEADGATPTATEQISPAKLTEVESVPSSASSGEAAVATEEAAAEDIAEPAHQGAPQDAPRDAQAIEDPSPPNMKNQKEMEAFLRQCGHPMPKQKTLAQLKAGVRSCIELRARRLDGGSSPSEASNAVASTTSLRASKRKVAAAAKDGAEEQGATEDAAAKAGGKRVLKPSAQPEGGQASARPAKKSAKKAVEQKPQEQKPLEHKEQKAKKKAVEQKKKRGVDETTQDELADKSAKKAKARSKADAAKAKKAAEDEEEEGAAEDGKGRPRESSFCPEQLAFSRTGHSSVDDDQLATASQLAESHIEEGPKRPTCKEELLGSHVSHLVVCNNGPATKRTLKIIFAVTRGVHTGETSWQNIN